MVNHIKKQLFDALLKLMNNFFGSSNGIHNKQNTNSLSLVLIV
jgi:hypothetical protein